MNYETAKKIDMVDYLASIGCEPVNIRGNDYWYLSPFENEKTASFKINREKNAFYCWSNGFGGTIIDFAMRLYNTDVSGALKKIEERSPLVLVTPPGERINNDTERKVEVIEAGKQITSSYLLNYLQERCIDPSIAQQYCHQVRYKNHGGTYLAIGFKNDLGGFEMRSPHFKGSCAPKAPTFIDRGQKSVQVIEGFMSFLSMLQLNAANDLQAHNFLVLNSTSMLKAALPTLLQHDEILLYADNDDAGKKIATLLTTENRELPQKWQNEKILDLLAPDDYRRFKNMSHTFAPHKDFNKMLMAAHGKQEQDKKSSKGYFGGLQP